MGLQEDAEKIISELVGPEVAKQINDFEDPKKYPEEFLNECIYFLSRLIGENAAKAQFLPLYKKYFKIKSNKIKS